MGAEASSGAFRSISDGISRPARQQACSALLHGWGRVSVGRSLPPAIHDCRPPHTVVVTGHKVHACGVGMRSDPLATSGGWHEAGVTPLPRVSHEPSDTTLRIPIQSVAALVQCSTLALSICSRYTGANVDQEMERLKKCSSDMAQVVPTAELEAERQRAIRANEEQLREHATASTPPCTGTRRTISAALSARKAPKAGHYPLVNACSLDAVKPFARCLHVYCMCNILWHDSVQS